MTSRELYSVIGYVDAPLIDEAETAVAVRRRPRRRIWIPATACACALVAAVAGIWLLSPDQQPAALPKIAMEQAFLSGMYGFDAEHAFDGSELLPDSAWNPARTPHTLPVYEVRPKDKPGDAAIYDRLKAALRFLGLDESAAETASGTYDYEQPPGIYDKSVLIRKGLFSLTLETAAGKLYVDDTLRVRLSVPCDASQAELDMLAVLYADGPPAEVVTEQNIRDAADAILARNRALLTGIFRLKKPAAMVLGGSYSIYEKRRFDIGFFDSGGSQSDVIVNSTLNRIGFYTTEDGKGSLNREITAFLSKKLGDYPILTEKEARAELLRGKYMPTVAESDFSAEDIVKTDLIYREDGAKLRIPYYLFYIKQEFKGETPMTVYARYYVPALRPEYLSAWDPNDEAFQFDTTGR